MRTKSDANKRNNTRTPRPPPSNIRILVVLENFSSGMSPGRLSLDVARREKVSHHLVFIQSSRHHLSSSSPVVVFRQKSPRQSNRPFYYSSSRFFFFFFFFLIRCCSHHPPPLWRLSRKHGTHRFFLFLLHETETLNDHPFAETTTT